MLLPLAPALLLAAAAAQLTGRRRAAHVARAASLVATLGVAWTVAVDGPITRHLYRWIEVGQLQADLGFSCTPYAAVLLVLLALWALLAPFLSVAPKPRAAAALDLAAAGAALAAIAKGDLLALMGCEVLLAACFLYVTGLTTATIAARLVAARRLLFVTRLGGLALLASLVFVGTAAGVWLVLLTATVLVGAWPFHSWFEDLGQGGTATGIRLIAMLTGVGLCLRVGSTMPQMALAFLAFSTLLSVISALATQDLFRAQMLTVAAQGSLVLAAATVDPVAALLLTAVYGVSQVIHTTGLARITSAVPTVPHRLPELGGLATTLPWTRWLALSGALATTISLPALWASALLAGHGWATAGPVGAAIVALLWVLPCLPLARVSLAPFGGPVRHDMVPVTMALAEESRGPRWAAVAALFVVAGPGVGLAWLVAPPPLTPASAVAVGTVVLAALAGFLLWHSGPRRANPLESPVRSLAANGFGIARALSLGGTGIEAASRFLWTFVDDVLFAGLPGMLNLGVRAAGWGLARLHDGWSGWAVATAVGTAAILLWSMRGGVW